MGSEEPAILPEHHAASAEEAKLEPKKRKRAPLGAEAKQLYPKAPSKLPAREAEAKQKKACVDRFCHPRIFGRVYQAFVGKALPQGQDYTSALAIDELYKAVLGHKTREELKPAILAATKGKIAGLHYAGDEKKWMLESVGYQGKMVNLHQMIQRFFHPLRHLVKDCYFSQANSCVVMGGEWRTAHRAENDALMAKDTFQGLVQLLHRHQVF